jgi:SET domain-containing protein
MTNAAPAKRRAQTPAKPPALLPGGAIVRKRSRIHGSGVFARVPIAEGTRIIEYTGERISQAEADRRYEARAEADGHTFLFQVDESLVVDGGVGGSLARFINHSCDGNCEVTIERRRIYIEATRPIGAGEELAYDYSLTCDPDDPTDRDGVYACRCGSPKCRGTMLGPSPEPKHGAKKTAKTKRATKKPRQKA